MWVTYFQFPYVSGVPGQTERNHGGKLKMGQDWKDVTGNEVDPRGQFPGNGVFIVLVTGFPTPPPSSLLPLLFPFPGSFLILVSVAQAGLELMVILLP